MLSTEEHIALNEKYGARNYDPLPIVLKMGEGVWVWDIDGKKYLDMLACYSALNHGHRHPKIMKALMEQLGRITLTSRAFHNDKLGLFYKKLHDLTGFEKVLPMNTGAEAVETAIKIARKWGYYVKGIPKYEGNIIVADGNFHGRTVTIISFSTVEQYRDGFGPFTPGFRIVRYGDVEDLEEKIDENTIAILVEPIQGEGGVILPPDGYLKELRRVCDENEILLILDEIQTGLGRTGKVFAYEWEGIKPDLLVLGKALGGGVYPVSAVLANSDVMDVIKPGDHGSTFGGNPIAAVVGAKAIEVMIEEELPRRAKENGEYFLNELRRMNSSMVVEIRGRGLMIGVELEIEARRFCEKLMENGILTKETHGRVVRFTPPLIIDRKEIDWALERIEKVLKSF